MPNSSHVQSVILARAWISGPRSFWKLAGSALLLVAVAHGVHGLVVIADDYIVSTNGRKIVRLISIVFMLTMIAIGLYILWTS